MPRKRRGCRLKSGEDFPARRELVEGSLEVWPINKYGALEIGVHRFYARLPGKPEQLTETGRVMILWKKTGSAWKVAESISDGDKLAERGNPGVRTKTFPFPFFRATRPVFPE